MIWSGLIFTAVSYTVFLAVWVAFTVPHVYEDWLSLDFSTRTARTNPIISVGLGCLSTLTDFYILAIPLVTVAGLNMNSGKKLAVSALFLTGLL
jgi:hypothetical protein